MYPGWTDIYFKCVDAVAIDAAPSRDSNAVFTVPFFILFLMVNTIMLEQLFVGVLVDHFSQSSGHALMTSEQKNWRYIQMCLYRFVRKEKLPPREAWRRRCFDAVMSRSFKLFVFGCILLNVTMLIVGSAAFPIFDSPVFDVLEDVCVIVYTVELALKLAAFGFVKCTHENKLDLFVLLSMWVTAIHAHLLHSGRVESGVAIQAFQSMRVLRLFDVMASSERLSKLVQTLTLSAPHVGNLLTLMTLHFFIFGVASMKLFGTIPVGADGDERLTALDRNNNFGDIASSMQMLVQISTGTALPPIVADLQLYRGAAVIPFIAVFYLLTNFMFLNLFIALVLENFEYNCAEEDFAISQEALEELKVSWEAEGLTLAETLQVDQLKAFVLRLGGQLAISGSEVGRHCKCTATSCFA